MKVLHIGLSSYYTEGMTYQDNFLPDMNVENGHEVVFVSNAGKYEGCHFIEVSEEDRILENGVRLIRYSYDNLGSCFLTKKIQKVSKLKKLLYEFRPDAILYHNVCGYELMDVAKYVEQNPSTLFYVDCHQDFGNTACTKLSKFAYKYIHGIFVKRALPRVKKFLYLAESCRVYLKEMYNIPDEKLEFFPLGGIIQEKEKQDEARKELLKKYSLPDDAILFMHSGKLVPEKKTVSLLKAFKSLNSKNVYMFIFGALDDACKEEILSLTDEDERVFYLGWKTGDEITALLNAADVYCQPGSPSATSQFALCCGCTEIVYPFESYQLLYGETVLYASNEEELHGALLKLSNSSILTDYKERGYAMACEKLDYKKLAERYLR